MSSFAIGRTLGGRYRLEALLARGGMGAVYRAVDERLGRTVAVKVLLAELASDGTEVGRFRREARVIASLHHPGIVQVLDVGAEGEAPWLVMEHVAGRTLADLLTKEGRALPERAADIVEQALFALAAAHTTGVVHRDIKPGNVMLVPTGGREVVKVLDFGIAQLKTGAAYTRLTSTGVIMGTPAFMAPEQAQGHACDARTDVYAMGVLLWCLLTGKRPFAGRDMADVIAKVLDEVPERADRVEPNVPEALARIADHALQKSPDARFASATEFANALVELRTAAPVVSPSHARSMAFASEPAQATGPMRTAWPATAEPATGPMPAPSSVPPTNVPSHAVASNTVPATSASIGFPPTVAPVAPMPAAGGFSKRVLALAAASLVLVTALGTCALAAVVLRFAPALAGRTADAPGVPPYTAPSYPASAPPSPTGALAPSDSVCERAIRCCMRAFGGPSTCERLRIYEQPGMGEENCVTLLASYEQQLSYSGQHCD